MTDHGGKQADGTGALASKPQAGFASVQAILSTPHAAGTQWRVEEIGVNPYADVAVEAIIVKFVDGKIADYTVEATDA